MVTPLKSIDEDAPSTPVAHVVGGSANKAEAGPTASRHSLAGKQDPSVIRRSSGVNRALDSARAAAAAMESFLRREDSQRHVVTPPRDYGGGGFGGGGSGGDSIEDADDNDIFVAGGDDGDGWGEESDLRHMTAFGDEVRKELEGLECLEDTFGGAESGPAVGDNGEKGSPAAEGEGSDVNDTLRAERRRTLVTCAAVVGGAVVIFVAGVMVGRGRAGGAENREL